jgi:hypothetical protein
VIEKKTCAPSILHLIVKKLPIKNAPWQNTGGEVSQKKFQQRTMFVPNNM